MIHELTVLPPDTEVTPPVGTWRDIMMTSGASGGSIYWRVVGSRIYGTREASAVRSIFIAVDPAGDPVISPTGKHSRPILTWHTNCNRKFKVIFGSDESFTRETAFTFYLKDPVVRDFAKALTAGQWMSVKRLVKNKTGSTIYWYIESRDELGRYAKTDVTSFVLTD